MSGRWLSRVRLARDAPAAALAPVLVPSGRDARIGVAHRLLWTLFADDPDRERDFLWREEGGDRLAAGRTSFMALSARPPEDRHGLFVVETKPFEPALRAGDRLRFSLRANAVVTRKDESGRSRRHDVVMDRLHHLPRSERGGARLAAVGEAGTAWLAAQGGRSGFELVADETGKPVLRVDGYEQHRLAREDGKPVEISGFDLDGVLRVADPGRFLDALHAGFGKAKAFGFGLMLIRRAP